MNLFQDARSTQKILIKTAFSDWHETTEEIAIDYARWKVNNIPTAKNKEESLEMTNAHFKGISFVFIETNGKKDIQIYRE